MKNPILSNFLTIPGKVWYLNFSTIVSGFNNSWVTMVKGSNIRLTKLNKPPLVLRNDPPSVCIVK